MNQVMLYMHGGSGNRGCEAIVRATLDILGGSKENTLVLSNNVLEDRAVGLEKICKLLPGRKKTVEQLNIFQRGAAHLYNRLFHSEQIYFQMMYEPFWQTDFRDTVALSVGGDHYCYAGGEQDLAWHNHIVRKKGGKSVLWGCSVEPALLTDRVIKDLRSYDLITARESITYNALKHAGITTVYAYPDPAFTLTGCEDEWPDWFEGDVVGINMSPYVTAGSRKIGEANYSRLIAWILDNTNMSVVLIPHVMKNNNNDLLVMEGLYRQYVGTGRLRQIDYPLNCRELKALIARCRFFIGARTHATIAAYSACVPTLVIGYSVKAQGIAMDIFGTPSNYVVPVQNLQAAHEVTHAFVWIMQHEAEIRKHLQQFMPEYCNKARAAGEKIKELQEKGG